MGQVVIQLCYTLQLRSVAVVSDHGAADKTELWLKSLGATEVITDNGSIKVSSVQWHFYRPYQSRRYLSPFSLSQCLQDTGKP